MERKLPFLAVACMLAMAMISVGCGKKDEPAPPAASTPTAQAPAATQPAPETLAAGSENKPAEPAKSADVAKPADKEKSAGESKPAAEKEKATEKTTKG